MGSCRRHRPVAQPRTIAVCQPDCVKNLGWCVHLFIRGDEMNIVKKFDDYMAHLMQGLGHADRHPGLTGYCTGLMLPLPRKSVELIAARVYPLHANARH